VQNNCTLTLTEIRKRLDTVIRDEIDCCGRRWLSEEFEAAAWVEPLAPCYEIAQSDERCLYIAGLNYWYQTVVVDYRLTFQKRAVSLLHYSDGSMTVPWNVGDDDYGLNFDRWRMEVKVPGLRDDCRGEWRMETRSRLVGEQTLTRVGTK